MTALRYVLAAYTIAVLILMGPGAGTAQAHPMLLFTDPPSQTAVASSPEAITLLFNEPVTIGTRAIVVLDQSQHEVPVGPAGLARDGRFVTAAPVATLEPGTYTVRWRVTGSDGDQVEQEFRFAVGLALSAAATTRAASPAWGESALRWLLFAGLAAAIGGLIARRATDTARAARPELSPVRSWAPAGIVVALTAALALIGARIVDAGTVSAAWGGRAGVLLLIEAGGLLMALAVVSLGRWALVPLAVVVLAEGIRSHAGTTFGGWGAVLTGVHLAAVTIWVGALVHTARAVVAWRSVSSAVRWVLASYVRLALVTYLVVVATGVISALVLVPLPQLISTTYGKVLLIKLGLVAVASAAALGARLIHRNTRQATRLRRAMAIEAAILVGVLAASAVLVSTPPPTGTASTAAPPQPTGPVLPLGALAGQIGISLTASEGLLVARLSTPRRGDYYAAEPNQEYSLAASLDESALALTDCGSGCYFARPVWRDGDNVLTLRAGAAGWPGGATGLIVSWPPQPADAELAAAVSATRAAGTIAVYETVTSDTTTAPLEPNRLDLDAGFFLAQQPYADGTAPITARTSPAGAPVRLALGYPAASINVQLTLDDRGRITEEILSDPKHLVTRRMVYPGPT
ncbi:copper resistance CopC/CopD family protein [Mycolicibacterium cosmeticum]|uniref:copper resistance CopC/CopD family protein n=1 Tax=Mycolicibacterium cosmeticum TaxID=258533 RepID=UPI0032049B7A